MTKEEKQESSKEQREESITCVLATREFGSNLNITNGGLLSLGESMVGSGIQFGEKNIGTISKVWIEDNKLMGECILK